MIKSVQCAIVLIVLLELFEKTTAASAAKLQLQQETLACYNCSCSTTTCPCSTYENSSLANTYCIIQRQNFGQSVFINSGHVDIDSTVVHIREFPYVLVEETITYDERVARWFTSTDFVIYGCNWNLCNKPELVPLLPTSFQMRLPEAWLNSSILGTGQPVRDCHECPDGPQCGTSDFLDPGRCPIESCNTTCLVSDTFNNPEDGLLCYQSYCAPPDLDTFTINPHRVEIEGVIYASQQNVVEPWEIDLFCRADDCSRPEIFKELQEKLIVVPGDLSNMFNQTAETPKIRCFNCYCEEKQDCNCDTVSLAIMESAYCAITCNYNGENGSIYFTHLESNSSYSNIREFPFVIARESILHNNETGEWYTKPNEIVYGCDWDYCNKPSLLSLLPSSLEMNLSETWLNSNVLGIGQPLHDCHECANSSMCSVNETINGDICPVQSCNTTCLASNEYINSINNEQCYQSYCIREHFEEFSYDRQRVEIEGVVYSTSQTNFELREVRIYCRADNCSRPEIFRHVEQELVVELGDVSLLFNQTSTGDSGQLYCYQCTCINDPNCECNNTLALPDNSTYCTIVRNYDGQDFVIKLEHIDRNSSWIYIREFPFMLVGERILYNEDSNQWMTRPDVIVYGCNTDFCNDPHLVPKLPLSFQMNLPVTWLNSNILGTGKPVRECHECPDGPQCGTTDFLDPSRCPIESCNTTCLVSDTFNNPEDGLLCYQSYCAPSDSDFFTTYPHRVEIEAILYGNRPNAKIEIWEVDLLCQADDCSRPELFKELQEELEVYTGDLSPFFNITTILTTTTPPVEPQLLCYDCFCFNDSNCDCDEYTPSDADSSYCTIVRQSGDNYFSIALEHINRNSTRFYVREFPYLLVEESITYDEETERWNTKNTVAVFGCNTDLCNHPRLIPYLPESFQILLPDVWLNDNILGTGKPVRECHECPDGPQCGTSDFLDPSRCPIELCNTTCLVSDTFNNPDDGLLCYQSFCAPPDQDGFEIDKHRVDIEAILYASRPENVELWEIDLFCRADDCSRPELFKEVSTLKTK